MAPAAVVCAAVPPVIVSRPISSRIRVLNTHRVGAVADAEARFRKDIQYLVYTTYRIWYV